MGKLDKQEYHSVREHIRRESVDFSVFVGDYALRLRNLFSKNDYDIDFCAFVNDQISSMSGELFEYLYLLGNNEEYFYKEIIRKYQERKNK